jgi:hypothetical protein
MTDNAVSRISRGTPVFVGGRPISLREFACLPPNTVYYADEFSRIPLPYSVPKAVAPVPVDRTSEMTAVELLGHLLRDGPMLQTVLMEHASKAGRTPKAMRVAQKKLGVVAFQRGRKWFWCSAADARAMAGDGT